MMIKKTGIKKDLQNRFMLKKNPILQETKISSTKDMHCGTFFLPEFAGILGGYIPSV